jgi:O-antigen/teichoic acid export membrane protein
MSKENKHGAILIAAFVASSMLNYGFSVMLSWFLNPAEFGMLGIAQSLLLLSGMAVGSGFAWTAAHDIALSGVCDESRQTFRSSWVANTCLGVFLAGALWVMYTSRFFRSGRIII